MYIELLMYLVYFPLKLKHRISKVFSVELKSQVFTTKEAQANDVPCFSNVYLFHFLQPQLH